MTETIDEEFNISLAKIQFVSVYLADPEIPIPPEEPIEQIDSSDGDYSQRNDLTTRDTFWLLAIRRPESFSSIGTSCPLQLTQWKCQRRSVAQSVHRRHIGRARPNS